MFYRKLNHPWRCRALRLQLLETRCTSLSTWLLPFKEARGEWAALSPIHPNPGPRAAAPAVALPPASVVIIPLKTVLRRLHSIWTAASVEPMWG